jgi:TetR/AcrR family transcriptional repressor of nem operon
LSGAKSKRDEIVETAEKLIRTAGYNGFSTREVANSVGIKAASVHYHFPSKADLVVAVTERYSNNFLAYLGNPDTLTISPLSHYISAFRQALIVDKKLCLCLVLSTESGGIPDVVNSHSKAFFEKNILWLCQALVASEDISSHQAEQKAVLITAALEGALVLSNSLDNIDTFESIAKSLLEL